jgi:hypothetical protein
MGSIDSPKPRQANLSLLVHNIRRRQSRRPKQAQSLFMRVKSNDQVDTPA